MACAVALMTMHREHVYRSKWLLGGFAATAILALTHVIPMPPALWQSLPGRDELLEIEKLAGLKDVWRPLTLAPMNGWHALVSLFAPLAILLWGIQLNRDDRYRLLPLMIGLAALSGFIGLLQVIGDPQGSLYFYRITNNGSAVGLFANRNHAATLLACLLPMLAVYASAYEGSDGSQSSRKMIAASIAIVLVPLILVTGSRSGLISAILGFGGAALLYGRSTPITTGSRKEARFKFNPVPLLGGLVAVCLTFVTYYFSRAEAIDRFFGAASDADGRGDVWLVSLDLFWKYFPWGSGSGSFVEAFQIIEPANLLDATYLNRAHNDWLETAITFGLPGVLLLAIGLAAYLRQTFAIWFQMDGKHRSVIFARMAGIAIAIIAIASISDYPLRTPIMMCVFAVLILWFAFAHFDSTPSKN